MDTSNVVMDIESPDTDVFLFCVSLTASLDQNSITFRFLKKRPAKIDGDLININTVCEILGKEKSMGLVGIHSFSGSDWGGKFAGISKKKWITNYLNLDAASDTVQAFINLGEEGIDPLSQQHILEKFVCKLYSANTACSNVNALRWELFRDRNKEGEQLPPTTDTLTPHIQRAHVISQIAKGFRNPHPEILPLKNNGWEETSPGILSATTCLSPPAPHAVLALTKCSCKKSGCSNTSRCSCVTNGLPCTGLCKCAECENSSSRYSADSGDESGDDPSHVEY